MGRPRTPGLVMGLIAVVLIVLIASFALTQRQPPPPSIAEFAPQAIENITESPDDQSSSRGARAGQPTPSPSPTPDASSGPVVDVPRVRKCVGDPPRQIEDPQSPPCVPYWEGDNGGATHKGVTASQVTIVVPGAADAMDREWQMLADFFNRRFEFYGRRIVLAPMNVGGDQGENHRVDKQLAHAVKADDELRGFASLPYPDTGGSMVYYDELARRRIVSVQGLVPREQEPYFAKMHPYEWTYAPTLDRSSRNLGTWACRTLAGGSAKYAGGVQQGKPRSWAILFNSYEDGTQDIAPLQRAVRACGLDPPVFEMRYQGEGDGDAARSVVTKMSQAQITTVLCLCHIFPWIIDIQPVATNQAWFPEWLLTSTPFTDQDTNMEVGLREHMAHTFGVRGYNKQVPTPELPVTWALREADPSYNWTADTTAHEWAVRRYVQLLLIASGIQLAGPDLTPASFADGLQKATFPNPDTQWRAGRVSFQDDHSMVDDFAEAWWGVDQQSVWGGPGAWCYVDHGLRHTERDWPAGERPVFQGSCY